MATTTNDTVSITFWADTREEAESKAAAKTHSAGYPKIDTRITPTSKPNFRVEVVFAASGPDARYYGKTGYVELVVDLPQENGDPNYNVWTNDGHVGGSFSSDTAAMAWAEKEGVKVRAGIVRRNATPELVPGRRGQVNPRLPG